MHRIEVVPKLSKNKTFQIFNFRPCADAALTPIIKLDGKGNKVEKNVIKNRKLRKIHSCLNDAVFMWRF